MTQEEKDELLKKLNQMIELSDRTISIWTILMNQGAYPVEYCFEQINLSNRLKEEYLNLKKNVLE